jgi:hypothetical protein
MVRALSAAMIVVAMTVAVSASAKTRRRIKPTRLTPSITQADQDDAPG